MSHCVSIVLPHNIKHTHGERDTEQPENNQIVNVAQEAVNFFRHEICGKSYIKDKQKYLNKHPRVFAQKGTVSAINLSNELSEQKWNVKNGVHPRSCSQVDAIELLDLFQWVRLDLVLMIKDHNVINLLAAHRAFELSTLPLGL